MRSAALTCLAAARLVALDCLIEINADRAATDQLAARPANADVFALVTDASKNVASRTVERHRPPGRPLATMLLRELRAAVDEGFRSAA